MAPPKQLIPLRKVGASGPEIPAVGFGLMGLSVGYGTVQSDEERLKVLDRAWELGETNWDTADCYADSEELVGKWFKLHPERRKDIFLATKFGIVIGPDGLTTNSSPEYCRKCIETSLQRLGVEYVDLYYMHRADSKIPIEKTVREMKKLVEEGKVKYLGLSEVSSTTLRRAHAIHPISAVQIEYNPWTLDCERALGTHLLRTAKELSVAIFCYSPLGRGLMTGAYRSVDDFEPNDSRRGYARFQGDNFAHNLVLADAFKEKAAAKGCTAGQLVLAWLLAQGEHVFVIPGTKRVKYLEENCGAAGVVLAVEEERELRRMVDEADVAGDRGPAYGEYLDTAPLEE